MNWVNVTLEMVDMIEDVNKLSCRRNCEALLKGKTKLTRPEIFRTISACDLFPGLIYISNNLYVKVTVSSNATDLP